MLDQPLVKSILLMLTAEDLRGFGHDHPMGPAWRGYQDINPGILTRERIIQFCGEVDKQAIRDLIPMGSPQAVASKFKGFVDAGMRVFKVMDYGGMAGLRFAGGSAAKVRETEDEILRLCEETV
jgi:phthiodiolone/phenolphthiodiolone dimycocerosates ketoreductase